MTDELLEEEREGLHIGLPKDKFFAAMQAQGLALTFDDVRLEPGYAEIMPKDVDTVTYFSKEIELKIPLVSAAMDTVTEQYMAIAMAKLGGLGIVHKNLTPKQQAEEVARVKSHLNGMIAKPIPVSPDQTMESILNMREDKGYSFHTFPVLDSAGKLVGILSQNDFDFCRDTSMSVKDIMTTNPIVVNETTGITVQNAYDRMMDAKKKVLPVVNDNGHLTGMYIFSDVQRIASGESERYNVDSHGQLRVGAAIGTGEDAEARLEKLVQANVDVVVIDTAHADSEPVFETLKRAKKEYANLQIVVGNISSPGCIKALAELGADGIKVGQGPGSICTTRIVAGIGTPQVTAEYHCAKEAAQYNLPTCADGGINNTGDIPIAIGAGAYSVMLGSKLAGTKESPGEVILLEGRRVKLYRGMGSLGAMEAHAGSRDRYLQEDVGKSKLVPEGIESVVDYKGPVEGIIHQCVEGLRKGMGYVGAGNLGELIDVARFIRLTGAGQRESHPHDVLQIKSAPNYEGGR